MDRHRNFKKKWRGKGNLKKLPQEKKGPNEPKEG